MFLNRIDNLHNHANSIILFFIFLIKIDTVQKPGNALITQLSYDAEYVVIGAIIPFVAR